jgi:hypothetical protein
MNVLIRACGLLALAASFSSVGLAQSATTFTYQGKLSESGQVVSGNLHLRFRLFNAPVGGTQQGPDAVRTDVASAAGVFSVGLDFGVDPFAAGAPLWLEIAIKPAGSGAYQTLTTRTVLTAVPSSISTRGIVVDSIGRVGINASPTAMLDVRGVADAGIFLQAGNGRSYSFDNPGTTPGSKVQIYAGTGGSGYFSPSGPGGSIEIQAGWGGSHFTGGSAAGGALYLIGGTGGSGAYGGHVIVEAGAGGNAPGFGAGGSGASLYLRGGAAGTYTGIGSNGAVGSVVVDRGYFGLGTNSPQNLLHILSGAIGDSWQVRVTNNSIANFQSGMRVSDSGFLEMTNQIGGANFARLSNTGVWTAVSDLRLKSDVRDAEGLLQKALALKPITYRMKDVSGMQIGFGAQQVDEVVPELVEHGSILTMDYSRMSVIAIGAIQEQEKELVRARSEIDSMRAKNAELEARLKAIEERLLRSE